MKNVEMNRPKDMACMTTRNTLLKYLLQDFSDACSGDVTESIMMQKVMKREYCVKSRMMKRPLIWRPVNSLIAR